MSEFVFDTNKKDLLLRAITEYTNNPQALGGSATITASLAAVGVGIGVVLL